MTERNEVLTQQRFNQGMTYDEWKASLTKNQELTTWWEERARVDPEDVTFFKQAGQRLGGPLKLLAIGEDWCGDVIREMPTVNKLATEAGLELRVFLRDQNEDLMNLYLNQGQFKSIPVVAIFTKDMRELGHFIERAKATTAFQGKVRAELLASATAATAPASGTPEYQALMGGVRERVQTEFTEQLYKETLKELRAIVEKAG